MKPVSRTVTLIFLLLALCLEGSLTFYWLLVLRPRLQVEARSQARILAQSQAPALAAALLAPEAQQSARDVGDVLDQLLLLKDPGSGDPFFTGVRLELDHDVVPAAPQALDLRRGTFPTGGVFVADVALFDRRTDELLGIAWFAVSNGFFERLSADVKRNLILQAVATAVILLVTWWTLTFLLGKLHRQVTERERAEQALSQHEQKYQRLVDNLVNYFVYSKDALGRFQLVSPSVHKVLGCSPEEFRTRFDSQPHGPFNVPLPACDPDAAHVYEVEVPDVAGCPHCLELCEIPVRDAAGRLEAVDGIARDVTGQRRFEQQLQRAVEEARAASRTKSQFLANVSHEIRTPLNAVMGMVSLALKTALTERQRGYLNKVRNAAGLLLELINDILDLSKIEADRLELERVEFDLDEVLANLAGVVGLKASEKHLEVLFVTARDVPHGLIGDPLRLEQVLLNLTNNAVKFTDAGEVLVKIRVAERAPERVVLHFSVSDTGVGIESEQLPRLFEPFVQVDGSSTRRYGGAGLGLAISKRLVHLMGGDIEVSSAEGRGSTFTFTTGFDLPATQRPGATELALRHLEGTRVLVVDDSRSARDGLKEMLAGLHCEVEVAASGSEGVAAVVAAAGAGRPFRIVLLDWRMEGLNGIQAAERLLGSDALLSARPALVLITAYGGPDVKRDARRAGIDVFLAKPVSRWGLLGAMLQALGLGDGTRPGPQQVDAASFRFAPNLEILLVEDNPTNRDLAEELLLGAGLRVTSARDGGEALRLLDAAAFDAVLMDVQMPVMDGLEATRRLRTDQRHQHLPIIAMTAHAMVGDRERFLRAGMSDYVAKPIDEQTLLGVLSRWLPHEDSPEPEPALPDVPPAAEDALLPDKIPGIQIVTGLERVGGNAALLHRLLRGFRARNRHVARKVRDALEQRRTREALDLLHTLRGSSGAVAAEDVRAVATRLEDVLHDAGDWTALLETLERALEHVLAGIASLEADPALEEETSATSGTDSARQADLATLIDRLDGHLRDGNLRARACFRELRETLGAAAEPPPMPLLARSLDDLDYDEARTHLEALARALGLAHGEA